MQDKVWRSLEMTTPAELECSGKRVIGSGRCSCEVKEQDYKEAFEYALEEVIGDPEKLWKRRVKAGRS